MAEKDKGSATGSSSPDKSDSGATASAAAQTTATHGATAIQKPEEAANTPTATKTTATSNADKSDAERDQALLSETPTSEKPTVTASTTDTTTTTTTTTTNPVVGVFKSIGNFLSQATELFSTKLTDSRTVSGNKTEVDNQHSTVKPSIDFDSKPTATAARNSADAELTATSTPTSKATPPSPLASLAVKSAIDATDTPAPTTSSTTNANQPSRPNNFKINDNATDGIGKTTIKMPVSNAQSIAQDTTAPIAPGTRVIAGKEDTAVSFNLFATDASGIKSFTLTSFPSGVGTIYLDAAMTRPAALNTPYNATDNNLKLFYMPPANAAAQSPAPVILYTAQDKAGNSSIPQAIVISVSGVADPVTLVTPANIVVNEGAAIPLHITATSPDTDGSEEVYVTIWGVPEGAILSAGTLAEDGAYDVLSTDLPGLTLTLPQNYSGNFQLTIYGQSYESSPATTADYSKQTNAHYVQVAVNAVVDTTFTASTTGGNEDTAIPLTFAINKHGDNNEVVTSVTITGFAAGTSFSAGTLSGGTLTLTPSQLTNLTMTPPANFSGSVPLQIVVSVRDNGVDKTLTQNLSVTVNDTTAPTPETLTIAVDAGSGALSNGTAVDATALTVSGNASLSVGEKVQININGAGWTDLTSAASSAGPIFYSQPYSGLGEGDYQYQVRVIDAAGNFSAPVNSNTVILDTSAPSTNNSTSTSYENSNKYSILLTASDAGEVESFTLQSLPADINLFLDFARTQPVTINTPYTATNGQLTLYYITSYTSGNTSFNYTSTDSLGRTDLTPATATITVMPEAIVMLDLNTASPGSQFSASVTGFDNRPIALNITAVSPDTDGSDVITVTIRNIPQGATLHNIDSQDFTYLSSNAVYNSTTHLYNLTLTQAQLEGLRITFPANTSGAIALPVTATSTDGEAVATGSGTLNFNIADITASTFSPGGILTIAATEDTQLVDFGVIPSQVAFMAQTGGIGNSATGIAFTEIPVPSEGVLYHKSGASSYTAVSVGTIYSPTSLFKFIPTPNYSGDVDLKYVATDNAGNASVTQATVVLDVAPVVDAARVDVSYTTAGIQTSVTRTVNPDNPLPLYIGPVLGADTDGSETLTGVKITGIPSGSIFTNNLGNSITTGSSYEFTLAQLDGLKIRVPANASGTYNLTVTPLSTEAGTGVSTPGIPSTITLNALPGKTIIMNEDASSGNFQFFTSAPSGVTTIKFVSAMSGLTYNSSGSTFVAVNTTTSYPVTGTFKYTYPGSNAGGIVEVQYKGYNAGGSQVAAYTGNFAMIPLADAPTTVDVNSASGGTQTSITVTIGDGATASLYMSAGVTDTDNSETIKSYVITGIPASAILTTSSGAVLTAVGGSVTVLASQIPDNIVLLTMPQNTAGNYSLTVKAISQELGNLASTAMGSASTINLTVTNSSAATLPTQTPKIMNEGDPYVAFTLLSPAQATSLSIQYITFPELPDPSVGTLQVLMGNIFINAVAGAYYSPTTYFAFVPVTADYSDAVNIAYAGVNSSGVASNTLTDVTILITPVNDGVVIDVDGAIAGTQTAVTINTASTMIPLNVFIMPILSDTDGSESVGQIVISNIPAGAMFTNNSGDILSLTNNTLVLNGLAELNNGVHMRLYSIPDGTYNLKVAASTADSGYLGSVGDKSTITIVVNHSGNEYFSGTGNADTFYAGAGADTIYGQGGDDIIIAGKGNDVLDGGDGVDRFVWQSGDDGTIVTPAVDHITDFIVGSGGDIIDLAGLFQADSTAEILQHLSFEVNEGNTTININPNGEGVTQKIVLDNVDLSQGGAFSDVQIVDSLLHNNQLITD